MLYNYAQAYRRQEDSIIVIELDVLVQLHPQVVIIIVYFMQYNILYAMQVSSIQFLIHPPALKN